MNKNLVRKSLNQLDRPSKDIVILEARSILSEVESIFEFITQIKKRSRADVSYKVDFLRPNKFDDGLGRRIVLVADPSNIVEHKVTGKRIYIIENMNDLKSALTNFVVP